MFRSKSLRDLEGPIDRPDFPSRLAIECKRLHTVPLKKLSVENLRMLVGQKIGLEHLVPIALDILEANPLAGGDLYSGDLLQSVAMTPDDFWASHQELNNRLVEVKIEVECLAKTINEGLIPALEQRDFL